MIDTNPQENDSYDNLPVFPLCRYFLSENLEFENPEEASWVEAESTVEAAYKAELLYGKLWDGRFAKIVWNNAASGEVREFYPLMENPLPAMKEVIDQNEKGKR